jgi:hypothetical protein
MLSNKNPLSVWPIISTWPKAPILIISRKSTTISQQIALFLYEHYYQHFQEQHLFSCTIANISKISRIYDPFMHNSEYSSTISTRHLYVTFARTAPIYARYFTGPYFSEKNPKEPPICNIRKKNPKTLYLMKLISKNTFWPCI